MTGFSVVRAMRHGIRSLAPIGIFCWLAGCAQVQMDYNVLTYDYAVADSANQLLLLNAVRASQHYPRSFTSVGQIVSGPPVSANLGSTLNFDAFKGLQTYNVNPSTAISAGYSQFALGNLNNQNFMEALRKTIPPAVTQSFRRSTSWPRELIDLIYYQNFSPSEDIVRHIDYARKATCAGQVNPATLCGKISQHAYEFASRCSEHFVDIGIRLREFRNDRNMYYNTPANYCHYERFRIFLEEIRVVHQPICTQKGKACLMARERSALEMIGYLGEIIAAQNYIDEPFVPLVLFGRSVGTGLEEIDLPLFVVERGDPMGRAAVAVQHDGWTYYIPRPEFGSAAEARSLQTLELVMQTVQAATHREDLPKTLPSFAVVSGK